MKKRYIELFTQNKEALNKNSTPFLNEKRENYLQMFERLGFPTKAQEEYKYTDLTKSLKTSYGVNISNEKKNINFDDVFGVNVPKLDAFCYFMLNENFHSTPNNTELPNGVIVESLKTATEKHPELVEKYYDKISGKKNDGLIGLNGAFSQDGLFVYVPKNVQMSRPIQLVNVFTSSVDLMVNSRNLIVIEQGAKAQFFSCDYTLSENSFFVNRITETFVAENAFFESYFLENVHEKTTTVSNLLFEQERSSNLLGGIFTIHNGVTRNTIEVDINGENCETHMNGMFIGDKEQMLDNFTSINHNVPHCQSNELFKHVLGGKSKGGFTGQLRVKKDAQKTEAYQTNKNIVLTQKAKAQTRPQLEIFADDVKCSHGATIGQLDNDALFYLQARGISKQEAKMLLTNAFTADVVEKIKIEELKEKIHTLVEKRLLNNSL